MLRCSCSPVRGRDSLSFPARSHHRVPPLFPRGHVCRPLRPRLSFEPLRILSEYMPPVCTRPSRPFRRRVAHARPSRHPPVCPPFGVFASVFRSGLSLPFPFSALSARAGGGARLVLFALVCWSRPELARRFRRCGVHDRGCRVPLCVRVFPVLRWARWQRVPASAHVNVAARRHVASHPLIRSGSLVCICWCLLFVSGMVFAVEVPIDLLLPRQGIV